DTTAQVSDQVFDARLKLIMRNFIYGSREMPNQLQDLILWIDLQGLEVLRPEVDLSRFDAAPLIAFIAAKETNYGTEKDGRIPC
ncbi:MAG: hypothetical protein HRU27_20905, partial [Rhizobiaceae bacterium]|nr:hypothetical protein [Rhizobiaceae bacterium]